MKLNLDKKLKAYREEFHLSQAALAKSLGVSSMTISRIESGQTTKISSDLLERILDVLSIDLAEKIKSGATEIVREEKRIDEERIAREEAARKEQAAQNHQLACTILDDHLKHFGFEHYTGNTPFNPHDWRLYINKELDKSWLVYVAFPDSTRYAMDIATTLSNVLGKVLVCGFGFDCVTVLFDANEPSDLWHAILKTKITRLNFDVRLLAVDLKRKCMRYQVENCVCYDGYGLFDFEDPDASEEEKKEALMAYGSFIASFNQ